MRTPLRHLLLAVVLSAGALSACRRADAMATDTPSLSVDRVAVDSARVIARWAKVCDAKGCPDAYSVRWSATNFTSVHTTTALADTARLAWPTIGDSVLVSATVTTMRRGIAGASRVASGWIKNVDAPPPSVDSLKVDTTRVPIADTDSFPVTEARLIAGAITVGGTSQVCVVSRNRYTGEAVLLVRPNTTRDEVARYLSSCEPARQAYQSERGG